MTGSNDNVNEGQLCKFLCGVVEGFYGRPWTSDQRKLLFKWMDFMGLNTYMYAPKDDTKHRAFWRDLYSVEEADNLTSLIETAAENNVQFVYAVSPGLDISFSSAKDIQFLKRKLEQVSAFGCNAFALLFDDIDPELSESDKSAFQSSACAQVSVTNELYEHLGQPEFYFCPTEYCTSRALPTLSSSGYLNTVGAKLLNNIHVLWTGSKVISKKITVTELEEVSQVLRRPPVIWDNFHANDYDPRRVFLGPYDGRSPEIIPYLRGVLTNPNCEFEANFIPLHTLGQWSQSNTSRVKKDIIAENSMSPVVSDIKLETESDYGSDDDIPSLDKRYQPKHALRKGLQDWLTEFRDLRLPPRTVVLNPPVEPPGDPSAPTIVQQFPLAENAVVAPTDQTVPNPSFLQPEPTILVNSLVDPICIPEIPEKEAEMVHAPIAGLEPMDCVPAPVMDALEDMNVPKNQTSDSLMQVEVFVCPIEETVEVNNSPVIVEQSPPLSPRNTAVITLDDLELLVSLFYTPFDHGAKPLQVLQDLYWLRNNAYVMCTTPKVGSTGSEVTEWMEKSQEFQNMVCQIQSLVNVLRNIPNEAIYYYLSPYLWDLVGILQTCSAFVKWLGYGQISYVAMCQLQNSISWFNKEYRDSFTSGDQEPWCFRGGLQAEFQRLLPVGAAHDLFFVRPLKQVLLKTYTYRPLILSDEMAVYNVCLKTCDDGSDGTDVFPKFPEVISDKLIGGLISLSPEFGFVSEDEDGVMGYAVAALDALAFNRKLQMAWMPAMMEKFPKPDRTEELSPAQEIMMGFHGESRLVPNNVYSQFPSVLRLDVLPPRVEDPAVPKRLAACVMSALKASGSTGVHVELNAGDKCMIGFYVMLGFVQLPDVSFDDIVYLGRVL